MRPLHYSIKNAEQIRALRSPVRQEIVDTVQSLGACSAAEIARELGRPADGIYYHLKVLLGVGLLTGAGTRQSQGRSEALYATRSRESPMRLHYAPEDPENVAAVLEIVASMLRMTERDFANAYRPGAVIDGPGRNLWAARTKGWLSDEDLREVNRLLGELRTIFGKAREPGRDRLHAFTFVNVPLPTQSLRRRDD